MSCVTEDRVPKMGQLSGGVADACVPFLDEFGDENLLEGNALPVSRARV